MKKLIVIIAMMSLFACDKDFTLEDGPMPNPFELATIAGLEFGCCDNQPQHVFVDVPEGTVIVVSFVDVGWGSDWIKVVERQVGPGPIEINVMAQTKTPKERRGAVRLNYSGTYRDIEIIQKAYEI